MGDRRFQVIKSDGVPVKAWVDGVAFEDEARKQVMSVASMPFVHGWVAIMPDVHWGMGATIGSVIPTERAIIPAAVGVDIGCGMMAVRTNINASELPDSLGGVRSAIEAAVPHGRTDKGRSGDRGAWRDIPNSVSAAWSGLYDDFDNIACRHERIRKGNLENHLGTLGTGNHFVEVCLDESDRVWVMLHSGSRGVGNRIGSYFIELAKKDMRTWMINLPEENLAYLPEGTSHFDDYVEAVGWAQKFARVNREVMMRAALQALGQSLGRSGVSGDDVAINCHHNYVAKEHHAGKNVWVTRKGAVRARRGDMGIIPGSMGARSYIVRGKGSTDSLHSCSHGAGRVMSRRKAKEVFTVEDHIAATEGVECRKDADVIDETPSAYKSIDAVMAAQSDLVDIVHTLRQIVCVKG